MRRIVAALMVLALCAGVGVWALASGSQPAAAGVDTPTPVPGISMQLDCDVNTAGIQSTCTVPLDAGIVDVDVVLVNNGPAFTLAAMNFDVDHPSVARLDAQPSPPCPGPGVECNPDFNELALTGGFWSCAPPFPDDDTDGGPSERSNISCYNAVDPEPVAAGESLTLATVHYDIAAGATVGGPEGLTLNAVNLFDEFAIETFGCSPGADPCFNAAVTLGPPTGLPTLTPTPTTSAGSPTPPPSTPQSASSPVSTPTAPGFAALDCALSIPGIQSQCTYLTSDTFVDVGVVFVRRAGYGEERWGSIEFAAFDPDTSRLFPPPVTGGSDLDRNPDLIQAAMGGAFTCSAPNPPDNDTGEFGPGTATSRLYCLSGFIAQTLVIPTETPVHVATVRYEVVSGAAPGLVDLDLRGFAAFDEGGAGLSTCNTNPVVHPDCPGATITLIDPLPPAATAVSSSNLDPTPQGPFFAIDCDLGTAGVQDDCVYSTDAGNLDVGVVFVNAASPATSLCCFNFMVNDPDTTRLNPPAIAGPPLESNPDANQAALSPNYMCAPPPPDNDLGTGGPGTATSFLSCFDGSAQGPAVASGGSVLVARVHYAVPASAQPGTVPLSLSIVNAFDNLFVEILACVPGPDTCPGATITLVAPPPTVVKVPEGIGDNADLSVPKANLWICELGPCAGPGEGALRVVEHATDVLDGLGAYEFTVEYDNFVISSVNPCDIVFGPGGAGDDRGPVDEEDESAINPDCSPDPGPGGGTCSYSHILENVIHFGCATAGQIPGPTGDMDLASLLLIPHEDLVNDLFPGNENGVLTVIKDNGCELVDILGHPVSGSINGGLVPVCGNLAVTVRILEGDLDLNCLVDVTDAQIIAGKYGAFFGSLLYTKWYDLEPALHDLDIDIKDIQKVFGRDGSNCQVPVPPQPPLDPPTPF